MTEKKLILNHAKTAVADFPVHDLIKRRWSPRAYSEKPVEREKLLSVLEAARWPASCFNEQPWHFVIATKEEPSAFEKLLFCLGDWNQSWAKHAPVLLLSVAATKFARNGKHNRHAWHDVGQAAASMSLQAVALGMFIHQMAGFDEEKARRAYQIPDHCEPVAAMTLGYPGSIEDLPKDIQDLEREKRTRKPLKDFVFEGAWGETARSLR